MYNANYIKTRNDNKPALILSTSGSLSPSTAIRLHISCVSQLNPAGNKGRNDLSKVQIASFDCASNTEHAFVLKLLSF